MDYKDILIIVMSIIMLYVKFIDYIKNADISEYVFYYQIAINNVIYECFDYIQNNKMTTINTLMSFHILCYLVYLKHKIFIKRDEMDINN